MIATVKQRLLASTGIHPLSYNGCMSDRPDWLPESPKPDRVRASGFRQGVSVLLAGVGLLILVPAVNATILDWSRSGFAQFFAFLPCLSVLAAPFFFGAWRIRNGPLTERQRGLVSRLSTAALVTLLAVDALIVFLFITEW